MTRLRDTGELCARCGEPAKGFANIGDSRYCHDDSRPSCYTQELWDHSFGRNARRLHDLDDVIREFNIDIDVAGVGHADSP